MSEDLIRLRGFGQAGKAYHRVHIHLRATDVGAPPLDFGHTELKETARPRVVPDDSVAFNVTDDRIEQAARAKFAADGWIVREDDTHDMDIDYDGENYLIEAWVR